MSFDTAAGIAVHADLEEETNYRITKSFWGSLDKIPAYSLGTKELNIEFAASQRGAVDLHPGAARFYREAGVLE